MFDYIDLNTIKQGIIDILEINDFRRQDGGTLKDPKCFFFYGKGSKENPIKKLRRLA